MIVGLPDGNKDVATKIGNVRLGQKVVLQGVLFVQFEIQFDLNLAIK